MFSIEAIQEVFFRNLRIVLVRTLISHALWPTTRNTTNGANKKSNEYNKQKEQHFTD